MTPRLILSLAGLIGFMSVALGAFGAHALKSRVTPEMLVIFETGVRYQMYHVFALIFTGLLARMLPHPYWHYSALSFLIGICIFSGSLYLLVGTGVKTWGAVTPIGGLFLLIGWALFAASAWKSAT